jgi:cytoskeleton protein RodZ
VLQDRKSRLTQVRSLMSTVEDGAQAASGVGADLRAARERLEWDLEPIAEHLRIRLAFLEAIEDGRAADLPGNAYAIGFLRSYATALGLDPDEITRRFREEASHVNRKTKLRFPAPVPDRGVPAGVVVLFGVILAVGAYAGWYKFSSSGRPEFEAVQPVPPRLLPLAEAPKPLALPEAPRALTDATLAALPAQPFSPGSAAAAIPPHAATPVAATPPIAVTIPGLPEGTRVVLRAKAEAWVQVRDPKGPVILNRVLRAGETWPVPAKGQFLLTTGNAGGTEILVDGILAPSLGADGVVRRDLPLDPEPIRDGKLTMAPVAVAQPAPAAAKPATPPTTAPAPRP